MSDLRADHGPNPYVLDIEQATLDNEVFRDTLWTGQFLQMTVMSIPAGGEIGAEIHDDHDQFLRLEAGEAQVQLGNSPDDLEVDEKVGADYAIFVPAGKWHNVVNVGEAPVKLYSIYAAPEHPHGTIHETKADSDAAEH